MEERQLLRRLRKGEPAALSQIMDAYSAYLYAIIQNIIRPPLQPEDIEEVLSDVFLRLWEKAADVEPGHLRAWLGTVARNRAKDKLRALHLTLPLEEEIKAEKPALICTCGPLPMLKAAAALASAYEIPCQVSLEERMGCGIGACLVCACRTKDANGDEQYTHVCKNGPVFNAEEVIW